MNFNGLIYRTPLKKIRKRLKASDEKLLTAIPENDEVIDQVSPEDYLQPDIIEDDDMSLWSETFTQINSNLL